MKKLKVISYFFGSLIISYGLGIIFHDKYLIGSTTLFLGFIQTGLMTKGKWYEEFAGLLETISSAIVCILAGLYGSAIFSGLILVPAAIFSMINWKKHDADKDGIVDLNKMTLKKSVLIVISILASSALVSFFISLIPGQNLPVLDSVTNILNVAGIVLIGLRYKEGWIFWLICNLVELSMWITLLSKGYFGNTIMMIITSVIYFALNLWGFVSFIKMRKQQENKMIKLRHSKNQKIETERLILREWKMSDLTDLVEGLNNFETAKNLTVPFPYSKKDGKDFLKKHKANGGGKYYFAIVLKETGKVIGGTNISVCAEDSTVAGGGIWLNEKNTGKGLGTEAWVARANFAFTDLNLSVLSQGFYEFNERSKQMQLKVGGKITGEKMLYCPALKCEVKEILCDLKKEDFYKYLKMHKTKENN